jgi:hypothetical protein
MTIPDADSILLEVRYVNHRGSTRWMADGRLMRSISRAGSACSSTPRSCVTSPLKPQMSRAVEGHFPPEIGGKALALDRSILAAGNRG